MSNGIVRVPPPVNEPVRSYAPGSPEKQSLKARLAAMQKESIEIPLVIGGKEVRTGHTATAHAPHEHGRTIATFHQAGLQVAELELALGEDARADQGFGGRTGGSSEDSARDDRSAQLGARRRAPESVPVPSGLLAAALGEVLGVDTYA